MAATYLLSPDGNSKDTLSFSQDCREAVKTSEKDIEITAVKLVYQPLKMLTLSQCLMSNRVKHRQPVVEHSVILFR